MYSYNPYYEQYLAHHGILGQRWGVRRYQNPDGSLTAAGRKRYAGLLNTHMEGHIKFKAKNGDEIELKRIYPSIVARTLSKINPNIKKEMQKSSDFSINVNGKKIGDVELYQTNKKELNGVWLGINKEYRGKGYATSVLNNVLDYAKEAGNKKFTLEVPGNSPDARHIYEKAGLKAIKKISSDDIWGGLTAMEIRFDDHTNTGKSIIDKELNS